MTPCLRLYRSGTRQGLRAKVAGGDAGDLKSPHTISATDGGDLQFVSVAPAIVHRSMGERGDELA